MAYKIQWGAPYTVHCLVREALCKLAPAIDHYRNLAVIPPSVTTYCTLTLFILLLTACVGNKPKPIETMERFTSQVNGDGEVEFAFGLKWLNDTPQQPFHNNQSRNGARQDRLYGGDTERFNQQPSKQTKLDLEDKAAKNLQQTMDKNQLCPRGYEVEHVIWEFQRIRLMGKCLTD
ncbi:MAG: hypothetical protein ACI9C4_002597 [Paraglaciecola sp.]|jgi:hypothetical protein